MKNHSKKSSCHSETDDVSDTFMSRKDVPYCAIRISVEKNGIASANIAINEISCPVLTHLLDGSTMETRGSIAPVTFRADQKEKLQRKRFLSITY